MASLDLVLDFLWCCSSAPAAPSTGTADPSEWIVPTELEDEVLMSTSSPAVLYRESAGPDTFAIYRRWGNKA